MTLAFMSFGFAELLLVGIVALLVFGGNLPDVMRTLGRSYARFRQSLHEFSRPVREEMRQVTSLPPETPPVPAGDDDAAEEEYPDFYDDDTEALAGDDTPTPPESEPKPEPKPEKRTSRDIEIDEPPPV